MFQAIVYGKMLCQLQNSSRFLNLIQNRRQLRVHNTLVTMILIFWITWIPQFVFTLIVELSLLENFKLTINDELIYALLRLFGALNTVINPLLYGYLNSTFRKYYKKFYRKLPWYSTIQSLRK